MENYRKGKNVEESLEKLNVPISNLPDEFLWMQGTSSFSDTNMSALHQFKFQSKEKLKKSRKTSKQANAANQKIVNLKKSPNRFGNMTKEEVEKLLLPDHIASNLDILIIGINPGLFSAYKGHHYANPGNHFWKCLHLSGLTSRQISPQEDADMLKEGIGLTNMVARTTKGSNDLTKKELQEGSQMLLQKLQLYQPKIAVFNGKQIYEIFSHQKRFNFGKQPNFVEGTNTYIWVMPSTSARCALLPRVEDKVPYFSALKKFKDSLYGLCTPDESELVFSELKKIVKK